MGPESWIIIPSGWCEPQEGRGDGTPRDCSLSKEGGVSSNGGDAEQSLSTCLKVFEPAFLSSPKFMSGYYRG